MKYYKWIGAVVILALLAFSLVTLVDLPLKGIADNGDCWRVMNAAGFEHIEPIENFKADFVQQHYSYTDMKWKDFISSAAIFALLARTAFRAGASSSEHFDLRALGILYFFVLTFLMFFLFRSPIPVFLSTAVMWVMADPNYLLFFNSFFTEPLIIVSTVGMVIILIHWDSLFKLIIQKSKFVRILTGLLIGGIGFLGGLTKQPYMLVPAIFLVCLFLGKYIFLPLSKNKFLNLLLPLFLVSLAVPLFFSFPMKNSPLRYLAQLNNYNRVFYGIAKASPDPERVLRSLHIPESHWHFKGRHYFELDEGELPRDLKDTLKKASPFKVFYLYLIEPKASYNAIKGIQEGMKLSRLRYPGHFTRDAGRGRAEYRVLWQFSVIRDKVFNKFPFLTWIIIGAAVLWLGFKAFIQRRWNTMQLVELFLLLNILSQMVISVLGDGLFGLPRHLILARLSLDLLSLFLLFDVISNLYTELRTRKLDRQS
jgi:hypothetical protein